jgi:putative tricarboxylic transport membrane protein
MQPTASPELGERAQRRIALAFSATLAVAGTALLVLTPALIPGMRADVPYYRSPAFFPMAALALLAVAAALHGLRLLRGASLDGDDIDEPAANWRMVLVAGAAYAAYIALVPLLGYPGGTALFLFTLGLLARLGWRLPLVVAVALTALLFVVFVFGLNVWFPAASLGLTR